LLTKPEFWFSQNFNSQTYEFGGFLDIISAGADSQEEFRIGLCQGSKAQDEKAKPRCYLMHFRERERVPIISRFTFATDDWIGTLIRRPTGLQYRTDKLEAVCPQRTDTSCLLRAVERYTQETTSDFIKVPAEFRFGRQVIIAAFPTVLEMLVKGKSKKDLKGFTIPTITREIVALAPIRTKPKRTYDGYPKPFSSEGEHTPYLLRKQLSSKVKAQKFNAALEKFGKESGLFEHVGIKGFGKDPSGPFEVTVTLGETPLRINSVGYGVSQALPVVAELISRRSGTWFSIQQPEVHLHPRAQAALGDLLFAVAQNEKKTLFIETHSDYTIDRFRLNYRDSKGPESQVVFFERTEEGNHAHIIPIAQNGEYPEDQPPAFRAFFLKEQQRILGI